MEKGERVRNKMLLGPHLMGQKGLVLQQMGNIFYTAMHARSKRTMAKFILACKGYSLSLPAVPGIVPRAKVKAVSKTDKNPCPQEAEFDVCETIRISK